MPFRAGVPRTTHTWLKPLYDYLDAVLYGVVPSGASGIANAIWLGKGVPITQLGNASGVLGAYGFTGLPQLPTGGANIASVATYMGASGFGNTGLGLSGLNAYLAKAVYGSTGTLYSGNDLVDALKNAGVLKL